MALSISSTVTLNNGVRMPVLGLGTWQAASGEAMRRAVRAALDAGYRLIDTAAAYGNEEDIGTALAESGVDRSELFVTTKLWVADILTHRAKAAFQASLKRLRLDYLDLYLIHWPLAGWPQAWQDLLDLQASGQCRAVGVRNFGIRHLDAARAISPTAPAVNQVEFSPFLYRRALLDYCRAHDIQVEGYSPLTRGHKLRDPRVTAVARRYGKSNAQLFIRWALQHGLVSIPKSTHPEHIRENAGVFDFEISAADMFALDALNEDYSTLPGFVRWVFR